MNIGFVVNKFTFGGGERIQQMLMSEFHKRGHQIFIITRNNHAKNILLPYNLILIRNKRNKIAQFIFEIIKLPSLLKKHQIDKIVLFGLAESFLIPSKLMGTSVVLSLRVDPRFNSQKLFKLRLPLSLLLSDGVVFQTKKIQSYYSKYIQSKSVVIHNPVFREFYVNVEKLRSRKIVSMGRLSLEKNFSMLISAFANIGCNGYTLHIYGEGPLEDELKAQVESLKVADKVSIEGRVSNVVDVLSDARIFVLCSNYEGMPNALIEAMAMGLVCVTTNFPSGGAEELICNYENGILIPVGGQLELEFVLKQLFNDQDMCDKISYNAISIRKRLDMDVVIDQWLDFIKKVD